MKNSRLVGSVFSSKTHIEDKKGMIVIADDDPAILDAMKLMLEFYHFQVETIADGNIIPKLLSLQPKLIFLDICMSGTNGGDICRSLKAIEETKEIPVIMISASCDLIEIVKESGADDYLAKPFAMHELLSKVNKYVLN